MLMINGASNIKMIEKSMSLNSRGTSIKKLGRRSIAAKHNMLIVTNSVPVRPLNGLQSLNKSARPVNVTTIVIIVVKTALQSSVPLVIQINAYTAQPFKISVIAPGKAFLKRL